MKTVLMFSPGDLDAISLYRHWGPMLELEKQGIVRLVAMSHDSKQINNWQYYKKCDFAFISRPATNHDFFFIKECEKNGLPLWVDMDDNLFLIPDDLDAFDHFGSEQAQTYTLFALKVASKITVATKALQTFLKEQFGLESEIIPNALDDRWVVMKKPFIKGDKVIWRGSKSQLANLLYFENEIRTIIEERPKLQFNFMGLNPWFITRRIKRSDQTGVTWTKGQTPIDFMISLLDGGGTFNFVVLLRSIFNETRSNNAWIESTVAGMVTLAPDWGEWKRPGIFNYSSKSDFVSKFIDLVNTPELKLKQHHDESWAYIRKNLLLSIVNEQRISIITKMEGLHAKGKGT